MTRFDLALFAVSLVAAPTACSSVADEGPDVRREQAAASVEAADPMAGFARLVGGEWLHRSPGAQWQMVTTWHWGPGRRSMRAMTEGTDASGAPWHEMRVFYWQPRLEEVRLLGLSPFGRGVSEGWIQFDGDSAHGLFDLEQILGHREMGLRWTFDGPDAYHDELLEATGPAGLQWMNAWDLVRSKEPPAPRPRAKAAKREPSKLPELVEALVGRTWEARSAPAGTDPLHLRTTFEYVPYADGMHARVSAPSESGERAHLFDAYVYHHTGTGRVRVLALSREGGVYEGDVDVLADGALELVAKACEGDQVVPLVVRLDLGSSAALRMRVWSIQGTERVPMFDVLHEASARAGD